MAPLPISFKLCIPTVSLYLRLYLLYPFTYYFVTIHYRFVLELQPLYSRHIIQTPGAAQKENDGRDRTYDFQGRRNETRMAKPVRRGKPEFKRLRTPSTI